MYIPFSVYVLAICMCLVPNVNFLPVHAAQYLYTLTTDIPSAQSELTYPDFVKSYFGDDGPLVRVNIGFPFPFYGVEYDYAYISPNGALQFDQAASCGQDGNEYFSTGNFAPPIIITNITIDGNSTATGNGNVKDNSVDCRLRCDIHCSYFNQILAFVADLNPHNDPNCEISWLNVDDMPLGPRVIVKWVNILPYWDSKNNNTAIVVENGVLRYETKEMLRSTFSVTIFPSGSFKIKYHQITLPSDVANGYLQELRTFVVGVRRPAGFNLGLENDNLYVNINNELQARTVHASYYSKNQDDWKTVTFGTYPPKSAIRSNSSIHWCVFGDEMCVLPKFGAVTLQGSTSSTKLTIVTSHYNCILDAPILKTISCVFNITNSDSASLDYPYKVHVMPAVYQFTASVLQCDIPACEEPQSVVVRLEYDGRPVPTKQPIFFQYVDATDARLGILDNYVNFNVNVSSPVAVQATMSTICTACSSVRKSTLCPMDCQSVYYGTALVDQCGVCAGGSTGIIADSNLNCDGFCFKDSRPYNATYCKLRSIHKETYCKWIAMPNGGVALRALTTLEQSMVNEIKKEYDFECIAPDAYTALDKGLTIYNVANIWIIISFAVAYVAAVAGYKWLGYDMNQGPLRNPSDQAQFDDHTAHELR